MSRKLALPLFLLTFALCVIFASRTPQPIIEELPSDAADAPAVLLTLTEKVGGQTVTLRVYELDEDGYARYALFGADGTEIDIPFGVGRRTWIGEDEAAEKVSLTVRDDVLGFPGFELETVQGGRMTVCDFYALTEQGFVYAGEAFGRGFDDTEWGDGVWRTVCFCLPLERRGGNLAAQRHCLGESGCTACEAERAAWLGRAGGDLSRGG